MAKATQRKPAAPARKPAAPAPRTPAVARQTAARPGNGAPPRSQAAARAAQLSRQPAANAADPWEDAKKRAKMPRSGTTVPARKQPYSVLIVGGRIVEIKKDNTRKIVWTGRVVLDPDYPEGRVERWSPPLECAGDDGDPQQLDFLLRDLINLGADVDAMSREDILNMTQEDVDALVDTKPGVEVAVVDNPNYHIPNVYFNAPLDLSDVELPEGTEAPAEEVEEVEEVEEIEEVEDTIDIDSSVTFTGAGGVEESGVVLAFHDNGAKIEIRKDSDQKRVKVPANKVQLAAAT